MIGIYIAGALLLFIAVLLIRAAMFRPRQQDFPECTAPEADSEVALRHLQDVVFQALPSPKVLKPLTVTSSRDVRA